VVPEVRAARRKAAARGSDPAARRRLSCAGRGAAPSLYALRASTRRGDDYESRSEGNGRLALVTAFVAGLVSVGEPTLVGKADDKGRR
jgi:hypothetical protein